MGQHKYNPTAIAAKNGEIEPKPKGMSTAEKRRRMLKAVEKATGLDKIYKALGPDSREFY